MHASPPFWCASSLLRSSSPLSSERSVTPCLLKAPRSPFSLCPFPAFQCSLVPLCRLIRGEQHCQPPPTAQSAGRQILSGVLTNALTSAVLCRCGDTHGRKWNSFIFVKNMVVGRVSDLVSVVSVCCSLDSKPHPGFSVCLKPLDCKSVFKY